MKLHRKNFEVYFKNKKIYEMRNTIIFVNHKQFIICLKKKNLGFTKNKLNFNLKIKNELIYYHIVFKRNKNIDNKSLKFFFKILL